MISISDLEDSTDEEPLDLPKRKKHEKSMGGAKRRDAPKKRKPVSTKIKKKKEGKTETGSEKIETCFERNETRSQVQTNSEI